MYVIWDMTWLFLYLFPLLVVENLGEYWRLVMRVVLAGYWYMYCGCPWDYMDSLLWDVVSGLVIDLTLSFAVGASWYICDRYCSWGLWLQVIDWICWWCKIHLVYLWGMDSWMGLALVVGAISAMDIFWQLWIHVITFGLVFLCLAFQLVYDFMIF